MLLAITAVSGLGLWQQWRLVEGYSMLLWILSCAGLIAVGLGPVFVGRGLGVLEGTTESTRSDADVGAAIGWSQTTPIVAVPVTDHAEGEIVGVGIGTCSGLRVPAGRWRVEVAPEAAPVLVQILGMQDEVLGGSSSPFPLTEEISVKLTTRARAGATLPIRVRGVRLVKQL